ncbi:MAG: CcmD family protein [Bacteroidia bacterium]
MKTAYSALLLLIIPALAKAQYDPETWDNTFRESGKIYVVVAVVLLILLSIFGYLITQDRRLRKLEKETNK